MHLFDNMFQGSLALSAQAFISKKFLQLSFRFDEESSANELHLMCRLAWTVPQNQSKMQGLCNMQCDLKQFKNSSKTTTLRTATERPPLENGLIHMATSIVAGLHRHPLRRMSTEEFRGPQPFEQANGLKTPLGSNTKCNLTKKKANSNGLEKYSFEFSSCSLVA